MKSLNIPSPIEASKETHAQTSVETKTELIDKACSITGKSPFFLYVTSYSLENILISQSINLFFP